MARLSDSRMFEEVASTDGLIDVRSLNGGAVIGSYSAGFLRAVLAQLNDDSEFPTHMRFRPPAHTRHHRRTSAEMFDLSLPVPDVVADRRFVSVGLDFSNILLGPDSTLVISNTISHLICLNFVAYTTARIVQETPNLVVDVLGSMAGGTVFHVDIADQPIGDIVAKIPPKPLKPGDLPVMGIQPRPPGV